MAYISPTIPVNRSPLFVIAAADATSGSRKILQIRITGGRKPSLAVDFTYAPFGSGVFSRIDDPIPGNPSGTHNWFDPVASRLAHYTPKYSHHVDGNAHFSQDGHILTSVRRAACPLHSIDGHAFTAYVLGVDRFPELTKKDLKALSQNRRKFISFVLGGHEKKMLTLIGSVYRRTAYFQMMRQAGLVSKGDGDFTIIRHPSGLLERRLLLASPTVEREGSNALLVELRLSEYAIPDNNEDTLLFIGGFDHRNPMEWRDSPGCLAARFPAAYDERDLSSLRWLDLGE